MVLPSSDIPIHEKVHPPIATWTPLSFSRQNQKSAVDSALRYPMATARGNAQHWERNSEAASEGRGEVNLGTAWEEVPVEHLGGEEAACLLLLARYHFSKLLTSGSGVCLCSRPTLSHLPRYPRRHGISAISLVDNSSRPRVGRGESRGPLRSRRLSPWWL